MIDNDNRPRNIDKHRLLIDFQWTPAMFLSILNRLAGMFLFVGVAFLLYLLGQSLESKESFGNIKQQLDTPIYAFALWVTVSALYYHIVLGIKHLLMDLGIGETLESAKRAQVIIALALVVGIGYLAYLVF